MSDTLIQLNNIRTLRSQTREMSLDVLEDVLEKFKIIFIERREEETLRLANESQRRDKLESLRQMMLDEGIDPSELMAVVGSPGKVKRTRSPAPRSIDILTKLESQKHGQVRGECRSGSQI